MSNPEGLEIARRLIADEARKQTGFLDLGMLGLTELPEEIHQLTHLRRLNLGDCFYDQAGKATKSTNSLAENDFSNPSLPTLRFPRLQALSLILTSVSDLSPLSSLASLQSLDCSNMAVDDLSPLSGLASLHSLDCSNMAVDDLSPLSGLTSLQSLDCSSTLVNDLSPLSGLANLQSLSFSGTLVNDLSPLWGLASLQSLYCHNTSVSDLSPLSGLASLQSLDCSHTSVSDLSPLSGLASLQSLACHNTSVSDLSPLSGLASLQSLFCSGTSVSDLSPLSGLASLRLIDAGGCKLTGFPQALLREERPFGLYLLETGIPGIPAEVLSQDGVDDCRERLRDHVTDLAAGAEPVTDVKVIVIGNGRIGKTQICNRLRGEEYEEDADSTHGITVTQTDLPMPGDPQATLLNLWDFGGQDLYHGTHALFLKSKALFVVVWTPAAETNIEYEHGGMRFRNRPLPYWLDYVRHSAGNVCPVVLIQNQCDTPRDEVLQPPADPEVLQAFPYLQQIHYSAKEDRKRDSLNEALREAIHYLHSREGITTIGKGRMQVRLQLQKWLDEDAHRDRDRRQHRTLTKQQFQHLCSEVGGISSPDSLLDYLHNAGIVFYRKGLFRDEIVLDQSWALDAIYTVFNREQCYRQLTLLGGRFTRSLLEVLAWPVEKYSREEQELFLSLMESCGICFTHRNADPKGRFEAEYVAPDLLPDRASVSQQLAGRWDDVAPKIERAWRFNFLQPGLARSIISAVGRKAGECAVYWKYGVWFYDSTTRASAVIVQDMQGECEGRIVLQTQGDRSRDLLEFVTEWINQTVGRSGGLFTKEGEPLTDRRRDRPHDPDKDDEAAIRNLVPASTLRITDSPRPAHEHQACVSYAWKEERSSDPERAGKVEEFCTRLEAARIKIVRDTTHIILGDRLSTFERRDIGRSDRVFVFLSDAYLKSPNCMYELLIIWQTCGDDVEEFRQRTRVFTMPGTDVFSIPARLKYAAHWKSQRDEIRKVIDEHGVDVLGQTDLKHFRQIQDFAHHVNEMLAQIADVLQPREFDRYIEHAIDDY